MLEKLKILLSQKQQEKIQEKIKKTPYPTKSRFHYITFKYAYDGVKWAFITQPNFKIHLFILSMILLLSTYLGLKNMISAVEVLVVLLISAIVLTAEMINTALEALSDEVANGEYKEFIRIAKDASSGAVLMSTIFAVIIGTVIYLPKILVLFNVF